MSRMCYRITATSTVTATSKYYSSRRMAVNFSSSRLRSERTGSQRTLFDPDGGSTERSIPPSSRLTLLSKNCPCRNLDKRLSRNVSRYRIESQSMSHRALRMHLEVLRLDKTSSTPHRQFIVEFWRVNAPPQLLGKWSRKILNQHQDLNPGLLTQVLALYPQDQRALKLLKL